MKIIGIMITWENVEFFKCAITQALRFCDEVILAEGCSSRNHYPKNSVDGTREYIHEIKDHPKLKIFKFTTDEFGKRVPYDRVQCLVRQRLLNNAYYRKQGNWLTSWDDDMFFFNKDLAKLKSILPVIKSDTVGFMERRFIYNFRFNTVGRGRWYFYRITNGCFYKPLMRLYYRNNKPYPGALLHTRSGIHFLDDICFFHYTYVKKPNRMKARFDMSVEKGTKSSINGFKRWSNFEWKDNEDIMKKKEGVESILGQKGFNIHKGRIPEVLKDHPWRNIKDIRRIK